jgi:AraC-like DNA-binding protein
MTRGAPKPARGVLHAADASVKHTRTAPVAGLAEFIEHFWSVTWDLKAPLNPQTLPHPSVHVLVEGARHEVAGVSTRRFSRVLEGQGRVFGIKFRPAMFRALLGRPVSSISNRVVKISEVFGRPGAQLARKIERASVPEAIELAETFFLGRVLVDRESMVLRDLVERAAVERSWVKAEQMAEFSGLTLRTLQRRCRESVGVGPKWVLQRYRLHEANERLKAEPWHSLAELALELGYVDQAHFIRDFRSVVGVTPGVYAKRVSGPKLTGGRR